MTARVDQRTFLKYSAAAGAGTSAATMLGLTEAAAAGTSASEPPSVDDFPWLDSTIADLRAAMASGQATALSITRDHLARIEGMDWAGPRVNSIIEVNPDAEAIAAALDRERAAGHVRGPLHGIPIVLKDVIATADGWRRPRDRSRSWGRSCHGMPASSRACARQARSCSARRTCRSGTRSAGSPAGVGGALERASDAIRMR